MLDALLATLGTLAVLASIAAKFLISSVGTDVDQETGRDQPHAHGGTSRRSRSSRVHRLACKQARAFRTNLRSRDDERV